MCTVAWRFQLIDEWWLFQINSRFAAFNLFFVSFVSFFTLGYNFSILSPMIPVFRIMYNQTYTVWFDWYVWMKCEELIHWKITTEFSCDLESHWNPIARSNLFAPSHINCLFHTCWWLCWKCIEQILYDDSIKKKTNAAGPFHQSIVGLGIVRCGIIDLVLRSNDYRTISVGHSPRGILQ